MNTDTKNTLYEVLSDSVKDEYRDRIIDIWGLVEDIEESNNKSFTGKIVCLETKILQLESNVSELKSTISDLKSDVIGRKGQIDDEREAVKSLLTIRQSLNCTMHKIYIKNKGLVDGLSINYMELASKTPELKKKDLIDNDGTKLALAVIHGKCSFISKSLALYYIQLNNTLHPPTTPSKVVIDSINKVRIAKTKYPTFKPFDLSLDCGLLDEIEQLTN